MLCGKRAAAMQPAAGCQPKGVGAMDTKGTVRTMEAVVKKLKPVRPNIGRGPAIQRPSLQEAEAAVRTLIAWAGDDPDREGLIDTPKRVAKAYGEFFSGYQDCPLETLS